MNTPDFLSVEGALKKLPGAPPFTFAMVGARGGALRLHCVEVIHTAKRKRGEQGVFRVSWQGGEAAAKIYFGRSALREFQRETRAYKLLHEARLPTPELLHATEGADHRSALLLFAWLSEATPVETALHNAENLTEKMRLAEELFDLIAAMQRCGLQQKDFHLRNFLFCAKRLYLIDLAEVRPIRSGWTTVCNLSKIINHQPASMRPALLQVLGKKHRIQLHPWQLELLRRLALCKKRLIVRNGDQSFAVFRRRDRLTAYRRHPRSETLQKIIRAPGSAAARGEVLQQTEGRRTVRAAAEDGGRILQCYDPPRGLQALRPSRAWRWWRNRHLLAFGARSDIRLPEVLACVEERRGPFRGRSWLALEPMPGESLATVTRTSPPPDSVDESLRRTFVAFYTLRALPQDLRAEGFLVHQGRALFTALEDVRYFHSRSACRRAWSAMQQAFIDNWPASHPCHARYREMLETIPRESPF